VFLFLADAGVLLRRHHQMATVYSNTKWRLLLRNIAVALYTVFSTVNAIDINAERVKVNSKHAMLAGKQTEK
jgi:hypothetical protein